MTINTDIPLLDLLATYGDTYPSLAEQFKYLLQDGNGFLRLLPDSVVAGDLCLTTLERDEPYLVGFLAKGDLNVQGNIYNEDTDGAYSLVVLGSLTARNILVGGQVIYVAKNVHVAELLGGDYNHGECEILGDLQATVIVTHDYKLHVHGQVKGIHAEDQAGALVKIIDGEFEYAYGDVPMQLLLRDEALSDDDPEDTFTFYAAVEIIKSGNSLLKPDLDVSDRAVAAMKAKLAPLLAGMAQYDDEAYEEALVSLATARALGNSSARLDFHEAAALYCKSSEFEDGEIERMRTGFERAIQADYQTNESRLYLAYSYAENDPVDLTRARATAQAVIEDFYADDDEKGQAHDVLGACLHEEGKHEESVPYFQAAVELEPERQNLQSNLGRALYMTDAYEAAIRPTELAVEIDEDTQGIRRFRLAFCCFETKRWQDTIKHVVRYCELDDDEDNSKVTMLCMQAVSYLELGQAQKAQAMHSNIKRIEAKLKKENFYAKMLQERL